MTIGLFAVSRYYDFCKYISYHIVRKYHDIPEKMYYRAALVISSFYYKEMSEPTKKFLSSMGICILGILGYWPFLEEYLLA